MHICRWVYDPVRTLISLAELTGLVAYPRSFKSVPLCFSPALSLSLSLSLVPAIAFGVFGANAFHFEPRLTLQNRPKGS